MKSIVAGKNLNLNTLPATQGNYVAKSAFKIRNVLQFRRATRVKYNVIEKRARQSNTSITT